MEIVSNGPNQNAHDLTIQWNLFYEPCIDHPVVTEPDVFNGGSQFASVNQDWHHNFAANYDHRWPLLAIRSLRWVNNVGYNGIQNSDSFNFSGWGAVQADIIGSNFVDGPDSTQAVYNIAIQPDPTAGVDQADCNPTCDNGPAQGRAPTLYLLNNQGHAGKTVNTPSIPATNVVNDAANVSMAAQVTNAEGAFNPVAPPASWLRSTPLPGETYPSSPIRSRVSTPCSCQPWAIRSTSTAWATGYRTAIARMHASSRSTRRTDTADHGRVRTTRVHTFPAHPRFPQARPASNRCTMASPINGSRRTS